MVPVGTGESVYIYKLKKEPLREVEHSCYLNI